MYHLLEQQCLKKLIKKAGSVLGTAVEPAVKRRMLHKLVNTKNTEYPPLNIILKQCSVITLRLLHLHYKKERYCRVLPTCSYNFVYNESL